MNWSKIFSCLLLLFSIAINAQDFTLGIKGGLNISNIGEINSLGSTLEGQPDDELFSPRKKIGTTFGAFAMVNFGNLLLRPEVNYAQFNNSYVFPQRASRWSMTRFDVPLLIGYNIIDPVAIYGGPVLSWTRKMEMEGTEFGLIVDQRDLSYSVGVLLNFGQFGIDLRYEFDPTQEVEQRTNFVRSEYGVNVAELKPYNFSVLSLTAHINLFTTDNERAGSFFKDLFRGQDCYCPY